MIKRYYYLLLAVFLVLPLVSGCSSDDDSSGKNGHLTINDIQITEEGDI